MDLSNPNLDPSKMSVAERKAFVHAMLTDPSVSMKTMMLAGKDGATIDIDGLVQSVGMEKVEDMLVELLGRQACASTVVTEKQVGELIGKAKAGTITDEEKAVLGFIMQTMDKEGFSEHVNQSNATSIVAHTLLDIVHFMNVRENYNMHYGDVLTALTTMMIGSVCSNPQNHMARYKDSGPDVVLPVIQTMAEDIEKTLDTAWGGKRPPDDMLMLALLTVAEKVSFHFQNQQTRWSSAEEIKNFFHLDWSFDLGDEKENGSNQAKPCTPECYDPNDSKENSATTE